MKIKEGEPFTVFENKMNQPIELEHKEKINFTPVSVKDKQSRVEHLAHTHVLNAEQIYGENDEILMNAYFIEFSNLINTN